MSGPERALLRPWTPTPAPSAFGPDHQRPVGAVGGAGSRSAVQPLTVAPATDATEAQADRVAASVVAGVPLRGGAGLLFTAGPALHRQPAGTGAAAAAAKEKAEHDKEAEKRLGEMRDAVLAEAVKVEPLKSLVAQGEKVLATPAGKVAVAEAVLSAIAMSVLAKRELPLTSWTQDLGKLHPSLSGATGKITWEGPANAPTKAGLDLTVAPKTGPASGLSWTAGGQGGTATPWQAYSGIGYAPKTGAASGIDLNLKTSITEGKGGQFPVGGFQAGAGYTVPSGMFKGTKATITGSYDTTGAGSAMIGISIPIGSAPKKPARRPEERLERRADPAGAANAASAHAARAGDVATAPPSVDAVLAQPGVALPDRVRAEMEAGLGADFSRVRLHADDRAASSARDVAALAYTVGPHVVFGTGQWRPETAHGRQLLAHELAHVVQQQAAPPRSEKR